MSLSQFLATALRRRLLGAESVTLTRHTVDVAERLQGIEEVGLYLHIPFCRQICGYCPYNKVIYRPELARAYVGAVMKEISCYGEWLADRPVTSFYVGGGTPTTLLHDGLADILEHAGRKLNLRCDIHLESHPSDLSDANLGTIRSLGIQHLSIGVEALQDRHLRALGRPYRAADAQAAIERSVARDFQCVNADLMFDLPCQTRQELEAAAQALVELGIDQVAAYPLFQFPYTPLGSSGDGGNYRPDRLIRRRRLLAALEAVFYAAGMERTSVWAFTRRGVPRFCSVTVPLYIGLGASGASYLNDCFYLNTFHVEEYIRDLTDGRSPIALCLDLTEPMQMAGWLYWRVYETRFRRSDFQRRFGRPFDAVYGRWLRPLTAAGLIRAGPDDIVLTDSGAYWLHVVQDLFSLDYVSTLWGTSGDQPWPEAVNL